MSPVELATLQFMRTMASLDLRTAEGRDLWLRGAEFLAAVR